MTFPPTESILRLATEHHQSGRLSEAEELYRRVLAQDPNHPAALYLLARLLGQRGRLDEGIVLLNRAIALNPNSAELHNALGLFLRQSKRPADAAGAHARAIELEPNHVEAHNNLGNALRELGRQDQAVEAYRRAISLRPDHAEAHSNLGNALRTLGRYPESLAAHARAAELRPGSAEIQNNHGLAMKESGDLEGAVEAFRRALALNPQYVEALNNLGSSLITLGLLQEATAAFSRAAELRPDAPEIRNNLGNALKESGRSDEAVAHYLRALELRPDYAEPHNNLGITFNSQGRLDAALTAFRRAMQSRPNASNYHGNLLYTIHFHPDWDSQAILREHRDWAARFAEPITRRARPHDSERSPERRLRIGYVSADFREHPVGRFFAPLAAHHDRSRFEVFCYSGVRRPDGLTRRIEASFDHWRRTAGVPDAELAERIRADRIDILVDLALHLANSRLLTFAARPAPVQATWLGYVSTTGLSAIDWRISDPYLDPPGTDGDYVEKTIRLPHSNWCYEPPTDCPPVGPSPALETGSVTFGCFNNFCKASADAMRLWAHILAAVPGSRLILHSSPGSHLDETRALFAGAGVSADRLEFFGFLPTSEYLARHHRIDIALDPFPCGGGTTTCDALWMGVPVVTLVGRTAVGRAGMSILSNLGSPQWIARDSERYAAIAIELASNPRELSRIRSGLRQRMLASPLMNAVQFTAEMEDAFRRMWRAWCESGR